MIACADDNDIIHKALFSESFFYNFSYIKIITTIRYGTGPGSDTNNYLRWDRRK